MQNDTKSEFIIRVFRAIAVLVCAAVVGYFVYSTTVHEGSRFPFKFGLDLAGGSHLVYQADVSKVTDGDVAGAMSVLRDVIERRTNVFGVSEPSVQVEEGSFVSGGVKSQRLVVELPGVTDVNEAVRQIGQTPTLEFKLVDDTKKADAAPAADASSTDASSTDAQYIATGLTGRYLKSAALEFGGNKQGQMSNEPIVLLTFNDEGAKMFADITRSHVGKQLAIFLDGTVVSSPVIREAITGGTATISGNFTPTEGKELVRNLNFGALPLPIELVSTQTIGASLGDEALHAGVKAGLYGFIILSIFMILWYRLPGFVSVVALILYIFMMLAFFKLIPVVLTAAGIAGFILSVGLAVDANILIAERVKEEIAAGKGTEEAIHEGFARAWLAIRDSNIAHIIASIILYWFGTALIKGFALVFALGVIVSMFSAITVSRTLLLAIGLNAEKPLGRFLLRSGFRL